MERTDVRVQIPVTVGRLRALKRLALERDSSIAALVREAIEAKYGPELKNYERSAPTVSTRKTNRSAK
jgi:hypothetical protein